jgi:hypothetical protein
VFLLIQPALADSPSVIHVVSRRQHAAAGAFDLNLPTAGAAREPRQNGANPQMIWKFSAPPTAIDGAIDCGQEVIVTNGTCHAAGVSGNDLTLTLTYAKNTCVTVSLVGIAGLTGPSSITVSTQEGDLNADSSVNLLDLQAVKDKLFQPVGIGTFTADVNLDGAINLLDLQAVKSNLFQNTAAIPQPAAYGQVAPGSFACGTQMFTFAASAGDVATITYLGPTAGKTLRLQRPDGSQLAQTSITTTGALNDRALTAAGTYSIVVEPADGASGPFSLAIYRETVSTIAVTPGVATPGSLAAIGEVDEYTFQAAAGQTATVNFTTPSISGTPDVTIRMQLVRPAGTVANNTSACGTIANFFGASLNADGQWKVRIKRYENWYLCGYGTDPAVLTGNYTLTVTLNN